MTTRNHANTVAQWLTDLAALTAGNASLADLKARVASMTAVLADAFPDSACFTRDSLVAIAGKNTFFPTFAQLHPQLADWWEQHRPRSVTVPDWLSAEDRANVTVWLEHQAKRDRPEDVMRLRLKVIRRHAPEGYRWLIGQNLQAASIAVQAGWSGLDEWQARPSTPEHEPSVAEVEAKRAAHKATYDAMPAPIAAALTSLGEAVYGKAYAPGLSPQRSVAEQIAATHSEPSGPRAHHLSPDHLRIFRSGSATQNINPEDQP